MIKKTTLTALLLLVCGQASAFKWATDSSSLQINLGDNVSPEWYLSLDRAAADWSVSPVLDVSIRKGSVRDNTNCKARKGKVEICNAAYGSNNWLGLATLTISGEIIESAVVRLNETYFSQSPYDDIAWRNMVMCHEVGHVFGVPHLDESWDNPPTGSCMDYSIDPYLNQSPNNEDFVIVEALYQQTGSTDNTDALETESAAGSNEKPCRGKKCSSAFLTEDETLDPGFWGKRLGGHGRHEVFERRLGDNRKVITLVTRVNE